MDASPPVPGAGDRHDLPEPFRVAYVRGVTPTKWARIWAERRTDRALELVRTDSDQTGALRDGRAQMAFVRLPIDQHGLNVIPLYREIAVAVVPLDHAIAAIDEIVTADLEGERIHGAAGDVDETFALVAAGVGIAVVPQSIARLHARRDLTSRPVTDAPPTQIALAWRAETHAGAGRGADADAGAEGGADAGREADADAIEDFIGIVRGRTERSSRGAGSEPELAASKGARSAGSTPRRRTEDAGKRRSPRGAGRSRSGKPRRH